MALKARLTGVARQGLTDQLFEVAPDDVLDGLLETVVMPQELPLRYLDLAAGLFRAMAL